MTDIEAKIKDKLRFDEKAYLSELKKTLDMAIPIGEVVGHMVRYENARLVEKLTPVLVEMAKELESCVDDYGNNTISRRHKKVLASLNNWLDSEGRGE
jgi:hypothetical protein